MVLSDYLVLIYLVLWCFTIFWVISDEKSEKVEADLSRTALRSTSFR